MKDKLVTIFGGSGFLGRYVAQEVLARGARIRVACRTPSHAIYIKPLGNLGQVQLISADIRKPASVNRALEGADAVINLVGSFADMDAVQNVGAGTIARAAAGHDIKTLVHISAIGADPASAAQYGQSKAAGEIAVHAALPSAVILRPSIIFGREDQFINRFAGLIRMLPVVPVIGASTKFQPVFVGDVAKAIAAALSNQNGELYELGGPQIFSMLELNTWIAHAIGRDPLFLEIPDFAAEALARGTGWLPGAPITMDQFRMLGTDNIVTGSDGLAAYGIVPTPMDIVAHDWLSIYRKHGRFGASSPVGKSADALT